jgi:hypothetical protein
MTVGNYLRIAGYASLCGVLLLVVLMQPLAGLQPLVLRVPQDYSDHPGCRGCCAGGSNHLDRARHVCRAGHHYQGA